MILQLLLFNLSEGTTIDDFLAFDRRVIGRYTHYLAPAKHRYLGVFTVEDSPSFSYAEVTVIDAETVEDARELRRALLPDPPEMEDIFAECDAYTTDAAILGLVSIVPSPNINRAFHPDHSLIRVSLSQLEASRTMEEIAAFDRRVTDRYSEYMHQIDWYYTGVYSVENMPGYDYAEVDLVEAESVEIIKARDAARTIPDDIQAVYDECRLFFGLNRSKFWLKPLQLNPAFKASLCLSTPEQTTEPE